MEKAVTALLRGASERGLESLLIGGNALILLGYIRNTVDLDLLLPEEERSRWLDLMRDLGCGMRDPRFVIRESRCGIRERPCFSVNGETIGVILARRDIRSLCRGTFFVR
jgi:hypothetical protein